MNGATKLSQMCRGIDRQAALLSCAFLLTRKFQDLTVIKKPRTFSHEAARRHGLRCQQWF